MLCLLEPESKLKGYTMTSSPELADSTTIGRENQCPPPRVNSGSMIGRIIFLIDVPFFDNWNNDSSYVFFSSMDPFWRT